MARSFILAASIWRPKVITSSSCPPAAAYGRRVTGIVQSPSDATARGMPTSALLSNHTDFCVLLDEMPKLLMSLVSATSVDGVNTIGFSVAPSALPDSIKEAA